jgi:Protein of unknown function (DUF2569)
MNQAPNNELQFKPVGPKLKGIGGWLAFFIIGQLILRPARTLSELNDPKNTVTPLFEATFPTAATLISIERALSIGLLAFGVVVAITLWKVRTPFAVKLTKAYLIANPVILLLDALVFQLSDLPPEIQNSILREGLFQAAVITVVCLIWFLYFTKSERVRATYYEDIAALGLR